LSSLSTPAIAPKGTAPAAITAAASATPWVEHEYDRLLPAIPSSFPFRCP